MLLLGVVGFGLAPTWAEQLPIVIDGRFTDWTTSAEADPSGDDGSGGLDLLRVWAADDAERFYLGFELADPILLNSGHDLNLYVDTDLTFGTGLPTAGIGAEFEWRFGDREGRIHPGGGSITISHEDVSFRASPAVTSRRFELSIRRDAMPGGFSLFSGSVIRFALRDGGPGGDVFPDAPGGFQVVLTSGGISAGPELPTARELATDVRVVSFNVLSDAPWEGGGDGIGRQLAAADADIYCFQEIYDHDANQVEDFVADWVDPPPGATWHSVGHADCKIVSRFPILATESLSGNLAALLDTGGELPGPTLLINAHLPCCGNDSGRQEEVDEILQFIRIQQSAGGWIATNPGTSLVVVGDLNLVGDAQQLESLLTGDIVDEATFGSDLLPDSDGSELTDAVPRQIAERMAYTWRNDFSSFWPGRLDFVIYSDSVLTQGRSWTLYSPDLSPATRVALGLQYGDSFDSDHLPLVVDFRPNLGSAPSFRRADCNDDQSINIADVVRLLGVVVGEFPASCEDACDVDDNGAIEVTDAVVVLSHIFSGGPAPSAVCAMDSSADGLDCAASRCP